MLLLHSVSGAFIGMCLKVVQETLEVMEQTGGPQAFTYIKSNIPTYESCVHVVPCAPVPAVAQPKPVFQQMDRGP